MDLAALLVAHSTEPFTGINMLRDDDAIWQSTALLPVYVSFMSACLLLLRLVLQHFKPACAAVEGLVVIQEDTRDVHRKRFFVRLSEYVKAHGSGHIFFYRMARLIGCLCLLLLCIASLVASDHQKYGNGLPYFHTDDEWHRVIMSVTYFYTSILAGISLANLQWCDIVSQHNVIILLFIFGVYVYRDLWQLATFSGNPMDIREGWFLWAETTVLAITSLLIPLLAPRRYIPVDPTNVTEATNPEQTASILSLVTFSFLNQIIFMASKAPHLSYDQLPPLADYDYSRNLANKAFPHLDPFRGAAKRHLFIGLMRVYRREYTVLMISIFVQAATAFSPSVGINRILNYLKINGQEVNIRPWFWVVFLFVGAVLRTLSMHWYTFVATRTLVRTEGLLMQLILEHSLRIRLKAEPSPEDSLADKADDINGADVSSVASSAKGKARQPDVVGPNDSASSGGSSSMPRGRSRKSPTKPIPKRVDNMIGKINTMITADVNNIIEARDFLLILLYTPLVILLCIVFLHNILGWSAFVGFGVILLLLPVPSYIIRLLQRVQKDKMLLTDARIQSVTEILNILRMIKIFGWETKMSERVALKREDELRKIWIRKALDLSNSILNFIVAAVTMLATFSTYTLIMHEELDAAKVFSSVSVFAILRLQLASLFYQMNYIVQGKVSLKRLDDFLKNTELLDSFSNDSILQQEILVNNHRTDIIGFKDAVFKWSKDADEVSPTSSEFSFTLRIEGELFFKKGCINLIVGPTGSGKTSLLMALLGEMHFIPPTVDSWFNLPREQGVAYAVQESWVQNDTIRNNILFGSAFDESRYNKVIQQCALQQDLDLFEAGDQAEVGERGLTLSGGQKARVTLARAIYSAAQIILLDDILAALDVHTAKWIVNECFKGDLMQGRTIILVTHNIALTAPISDFTISVDLDGRIRSENIENYISATLIEEEAELEMEINLEELDKGSDSRSKKEETKSDGRLILAEEIAEGRVAWKAFKLFLSGLGGSSVPLFFSICIVGVIFTDWANTFQTWFLGYWGSQYESHPSSEVPVLRYVAIYATIMMIATVVYSSTYLFYVLATLRASRNIHKMLLKSVLGATYRWLDETPTSRILARCTQDIQAIDGMIPIILWSFTENLISATTKLSIVVLFNPLFLLPGITAVMLGLYTARIYLKAQLSVKREMSNARAPLVAHFGTAISGLTSIRAYGAQEAFKTESHRRIDHYIRVARVSFSLNRWMAVRIDFLGAILTATLAGYLIYRGSAKSANTGLSLNLMVDFCNMLLFLVRIYSEFEVQSNSLERIQTYLDIEHEEAPTESGKPPAAWPTSGELRVEELSARYSQGGPKVLHGISFNIRSGERIGIVGRTGSGKSSLTLALLRCILTEGRVYFDGLLTSDINLDALRSNITIIPQMPELLSGTLRRNLDPFEQYDDATLNSTLLDAGLFSLQSELEEGRLTLESNVSSGGGNLSVGQRQIIALARAIVRQSKLLILDEATSAIDFKTDTVIQATLRSRLGSDVTVITIAHRLQTIMDADKIMVLDNGRIVEFDNPKTLLKKEGGRLKALIDESGDRAALYALAEGKASISQ